ncbi:zinc finger MYM-type protein 3-like isoform X2 [Argopecten irradians]|uniref:zinc finger MYM-type protein 3-like isoform X2 n=1 Tax=Argopecten irradians TaxID=31199 RepID=UPI0037134A1A
MSEAGPASESSPNDNKDTPLDHLKEHQEEDGQAENTEETMDQNLDKETANADASQEQTEESEDKEEENQKETTSAEDNDNQMGDELEVPKLSSTVYDAAFEEEPSAVEDTPTVVNSSAVEDTPAIVNSSAVEDTPGVVNSSAVEDTPNVVDSLAVEDTLIAGVSSTVEESIAVDDVSVLAVRDTPNEDSTSFLQNKINEDESSEVQDTPGVEEPSTVEKLPVAADAMDSPVVDNSPVPKEPVEDPPEVDESFNLMVEDSHVEEGSPLSDDLVTETNNNENVEGAEGVSLTENDQSQTESQPMHEDNEVDKNDDAKTEEKRTRMQLDEDDDKLLADEESLKANAEDGKQEDQDNVAEDKLLADSENQESSELMENSENNSGNEEKFNQSKPNEDEDSTGDIQLQIGSVTGNAEMVDDSEVMEVDQDSTPKDEDSSKVTEVAEEKKDGDDDVEMIEADEKEDEKEVIDIKDDDVEMKEDGNKQNESTAEAQKIKTEQEEKPEDTKPIVDDDDDDDDVKIIDVQSKDNSKAKEVKVKDENKDAVSNGEMCLQIASVSGGVDMPEQNFDDKKEEKKDLDTKVKEETGSKDIKQEPKSGESKSKSTSKIQTCIVCQKIGKCKYNIVRNGDVKHLCDDTCFKQFRANPTMFLRASTDNQVTKKPDSPAQAPPPNVPSPGQERYKTCSICQLMNVKTSKPFLNWQCMDFCGEDCLGKFQAGLNAACNYCGQTVPQASKAKFCARVDDNVKQFCSAPCYNEFKKRQKLCEYCQKDVTKISDAFVAPVGKEALFKDFCSQGCLQKYEAKSNDVEIVGVDRPQKSQVPPKGNFQCAVCRKTGPVKHEIKLEGKMNRLCGDPCFSAFQYANKLTMNTCDNCGVYCYNEGMAPQYIQFEGQQKRFCSFMCVNTFKTLNKKVVSCAWCNCKKSNFDMIERVDANNKYQLFCSLNCLSLYRVNLQATSNQAVVCDQCRKFVPAQYHLTMSDASVRNFCSYQCVMTFQSQFAGGAGKSQTPIMNTAPQNQKSTPARTPARNTPTRASARANTTQQKQANVPVISNVVSLSTQIADASKTQAKKPNAPLPRGSQQQTVRSNQMPALTNSQSQPRSSVTNTSMQTPPQQIIIQPPPPKTVKNKSLLCKPFVQTKATSCRPHTQTKETQTDESAPKQMVIPIPIPYYIPVPMMMYTQYTPVPLPIPVPIPVPCFIPTTKKSSSSIFKHIKEIQERIPSDPLEAELLMMAEAVAVADPESDSDTENEDILPASKMLTGDDGDTLSNSPSPIPDPVPEVTPAPGQSNGEFGEDMLQMALRMATEMTSEPVMDLESSIDPVPVNTDPPPPAPQEEEEEELVPARETRSRGRGPKRSGSRGNRKSKRQKVVHPLEQEEKMESEPAIEPEVPEIPPDANMYLKYTYGVNAWKHWVVLKNAQLEKVSNQGSGKLKLFKTDMMGCSADELNYSLCLFVKEVRKPNGDEYAPDSIYYLCLGIQQYLFENSRIDNIFTDVYYEKFTECLNEVLNRYEPKINTAGQLVCRIEEEHLWECKQLGAHSPHVLLNTLVFFNTKFFMLKEVDEHIKLSFTHIMKHWKKTPIGRNNTTGRTVYLRYYCPNPTKATDMNQKKKTKDEVPVYEQAENLDNPLRCPVKLYEFYLSKCPESIKNRNDAFYLTPERSCVPDSPVWYSTQNLSSEAMNKMLNRARLVREIQEAMLHTQPVYM